ncbi:MAG: hypothetical protein JO296_13710 [Pseudonocardiales bacterium]|nr:hypothetical protein [Pseudonocardiales bacterium]MBV9651176.1 hypothetical protein [Pseudonocardiales bacterium]
MDTQPVALKVLLQHRHLQTHRAFCREYDRVAAKTDPTLRGGWPSKAQFYRWLSGELVGIPYPDHCRILEKMFPDWRVDQLFQPYRGGIDFVPEPSMVAKTSSDPPALQPKPNGSIGQNDHLVTSGGELTAALIDVVRNAQECLVAVGSRSSEISYLQEIERVVQDKPRLVHYRILMGLPHSQVLKDHLLRLLTLRPALTDGGCDGERTLHICIINDLTRYPERFFVASERAAVIILPSANSPMNFDTAIVVHEPQYVHRLLQHGKALYGKNRIESLDAINLLEVIE